MNKDGIGRKVQITKGKCKAKEERPIYIISCKHYAVSCNKSFVALSKLYRLYLIKYHYLCIILLCYFFLYLFKWYNF